MKAGWWIYTLDFLMSIAALKSVITLLHLILHQDRTKEKSSPGACGTQDETYVNALMIAEWCKS